MTAELRCQVEQIGTRLLVRLAGELTLETAPQVRMTLLKCLVDQPDVMLVDLSRLTIGEPTTVALFSVIARRAAMWPGTPILLCAPRDDVAAMLARRPRQLAVHPTVEQALVVEPDRQQAVSDMLLPVGGAGHRARKVAVDACTRWDLPHLCVPAGLVAAELVSNAAVHASTMLDLRITKGRRYLVIAVRDGSTDVPGLLPAAPGPVGDSGTANGLLLVDAVARRWGSTPTDGGKVMWATLGLHPSAG